MENENFSFGAKAKSLYKLSAAGFCVPDFSVIPFEIYLKAKKNNFESIPEVYLQDFNSTLSKFKDTPVAVRSSATKEDGETASFAGLFESYLNVQGADQIEAAVKACWQSTHTERTVKYCEKNKIFSDEISMAVIIQKYIEPDFAGVVFTVNPVTGNDQEILMEACPGSGDKLVSGQVNPSRFLFQREGKILKDQFDDQLKINPSDKILSELREQCLKIQALYGRPQDIEFAVKDDKIYILQSRDITKILFSKNLGDWSTADFRDGGVSSAVVSPIMWSLYEKIFCSSLPGYFKKLGLISDKQTKEITWYRVFYGRPYWNLRAIKEIQEAMPGYNERNFDQDMALPINYEGDGVVTPVTVSGLIKALPVLFKLHAEYKQQVRRSEELIKNFNIIEKKYQTQDLSKMSDEQLKSSFVQLIEEDYTFIETEYFLTIFNASNAKLEFSDALKPYKKIDSTIEYVSLISNLENLEVTGPAYALAEIAGHLFVNKKESLDLIEKLIRSSKNKINIEDLKSSDLLYRNLKPFIEKFYFHSERELDLLVPRWNEDLRFVLQTLSALLLSHEPGLQRRLKCNQYEVEILKLKRAHKQSMARFVPGSFSSVEKKLNRIRHFLWLREEVRDRSTRVYSFIRQHLVELGHRTGLKDQIFYLSYQSILKYCQAQIAVELLSSEAQETKLYADGFVNFKNSNEIGFRFNQASWSARSQVSDGKLSYFGIGCSSGVVRAQACVIKNISESSKLKSGQVMIVPFTDPGWTPLFSLAAGVVTETGGLLSHAALISREYGIPCVLNLNSATDLIHDQTEVEINGMEGRVTIL